MKVDGEGERNEVGVGSVLMLKVQEEETAKENEVGGPARE